MDSAGRQTHERPISQGLANDACFFPSPGGNVNALRQDGYSTFVSQCATEKDILHQSNIWKSAQAKKIFSPQEQALIAINEAGDSDPRRSPGVDPSIPSTKRVNPHAKTSGNHFGLAQTFLCCFQRSSFQTTIGVQEDKNIAGRMSGA